ncbi:alpha/beta hydrolase [Actinomadura welshii]|uniref:alpha/beta hydrolase n=1 Tax=Actinomadura welshii TaxID=3103817 RepID=UPI0003AD648C|nr:alpha/beta hydrolase [Actinomadura madurae]
MELEQQSRAAAFERLMPPVDHGLYVPAGLLDPPAVDVLPGTHSHLQVAFAELHGWRALRLDVHVPAEGAGPWPVVVYVHGGSFLTGLPGMGPWTTLPEQGIAVVSVTYRLSAEAGFPEPVEDVRAAVAWVQARADRYGFDADRVALWGGSAGGYLAALVAVTSGRPLAQGPRLLGTDGRTGSGAVAAVVTQYAVTDPAHLAEDAMPGADVSGLVRATRPFFGATQVPTAVVDHLADPRSVAPFLVMHGDADRRVGIAQGRRLHSALENAGVRSRFIEVKGADHGTPEWADPAVVAEVVAHVRRPDPSRVQYTSNGM